MKSRRTRRFKRQRLIATETMLRLESSQQQYVKIPMANDGRWDFGTQDFTISFLTSIDAGNVPIWLQLYNTIDGAQIIFTFDQVSGIRLTSNQGTIYQIPSNLLVSVQPEQLCRLTVMRKGGIVEAWLNNRKIGEVLINVQHTFNFFAVNNQFYLGAGRLLQASYLKGYISNFIVLKGKALSNDEMSWLHDYNILPEGVLPFCVAHYPLNQYSSDRAYDAVEQYNYAKAVPINAVHGDLINYSNQTVGSDNIIEQTAWPDIYSKKNGKVLLTFRSLNSFGEAKNYDDQILGTDWAIAFETSPPLTVDEETDYYTIFSTVGKPFGTGVYNQMYAAWRWVPAIDTSTEGKLAIGVYQKNGGAIIPLSGTIPGTPTWRVNHPVQKKYTVVMYSKYSSAVLAQGYGVWVNGKQILGFNPVFGRDTAFIKGIHINKDVSRFGKGGIGKFVIYSGAITDRVINLLNNISESNDYKSLGGIHLDIDCSSVFKIGNEYNCKDHSGNNRHLKLVGFNIKQDQPYHIDRNTGLPVVRKALRFLRSKSHYLTVPDFNPSKEKGYTYIIGFKSDSEKFDFENGACLFSKRSNSYQQFKAVFCNADQTSVSITQKTEGFGQEADVVVDFKDIEDLCFLAVTEPAQNFGEIKAFANGFFAKSGAQRVIGFDEIQDNQDLRIGVFDVPGTNSLGGYLFFFGIWKGVLTREEIFNVINYTLKGSSIGSLMKDCQLFLTFDTITDDNGVFEIKDWSPQDRTVILNNYTLAEIFPLTSEYKLFDLNTIRDGNLLFPDPKLPASIQPKTLLWYDTNFRKYLNVADIGTVMSLLDKNGDPTKTASNGLFGTNGLHYRRFKETKYFFASHVLINDPGNAHTEFSMAFRNMDFMHNGSEWFAAIVFGHNPHDSTPYTINLFSTGSNNNNINGCAIQVPSTDDFIHVMVSSIAGPFGNVVFYRGAMTRGSIHLIILSYDPALSNNNLSMYLDGSNIAVPAENGSSRKTKDPHNAGVSSIVPQFYQRQTDGNRNQQWCGEMIFGNQKLGAADLNDLITYFNNKYGAFPKVI